MRLIVTGAAGRRGRRFAEQLLERVAPADLILVTRHPEALHEFGVRGTGVHDGASTTDLLAMA